MTQDNDALPIRRALLSVSDKTGIAELADFLAARGVEILSTGGTARLLRERGVETVDVSSYTGFPEMMGGRLKTLHPKIYGGLLDRGEQDRADMNEHAIEKIDLLVVNLYPFEKTISLDGATVEQCIENIDIGGPAMVRAAAKNHRRVAVVVDCADYDSVMSQMRDNDGRVSFELRSQLAVKAFQRTGEYDAAISRWMKRVAGGEVDAAQWPPRTELPLSLVSGLRYGENPHQHGAFYAVEKSGPVAAKQLQGKAMSYNNFLDANTAHECVFHFEEAACVIVKHTTPCGVACMPMPAQAYRRAVEVDPVSAYGGIVAFNREVDAEAAQAIVGGQFVELVAAPAFSVEAVDILAGKSALRVLVCAVPETAGLRYRSAFGGMLVQEGDGRRLSAEDLAAVTTREPGKDELEDLLFAWRVVKFVKSNAIVFAHGKATAGIGGGQTSRVASVRIAAERSRTAGKPLCMASDAFFPFRDSIDTAAEAGVSAIIQPGGSIHDDAVVSAANEHNIAMVFTGVRHFLH